MRTIYKTKRIEINRPMTKVELANKEIERLEEENERYRIAINEMTMNISKAIEYIEKHSNSFSVLDTISNAELLKILKGSDKE